MTKKKAENAENFRKRNCRVVSAAEDKIINMYREGYVVNSIAKEANISTATVYDILERRGETLKGQRKQPVALSEKDIAFIETASAFMRIQDIAHYLRISETTFNKIKNEDSRVDEAYKKGKAAGIMLTTNSLQKNIKKGCPASIIFTLKTQANWSTKGEKENYKRLKLEVELLRKKLEALTQFEEFPSAFTIEINKKPPLGEKGEVEDIDA